MRNPWETHYKRDKSALFFPDENLVRLLKKALDASPKNPEFLAIDLGCGSGRHLSLCRDLGIPRVIGADRSLQGLSLARHASPGLLVRCDNRALPFADACADIIIAWGSLHYDHKKELPAMLSEIRRVLKQGGRLFATLRSSRDTYLRHGQHLGDDVWVTDLEDIKGTTASFFSEAEVKEALAPFSERRLGLIERTIMDRLDQVISHWVIEAVR